MGRSETRFAAVATAAVSFVLGSAFVLVWTAGATQAEAPADPVGANVSGPAALSYDLDGLPDGTVLVVERRNGPKGSFVEVSRSTRVAGGLQVGVPTDDRSVLRFTLVSSDGAVLATVDRHY